MPIFGTSRFPRPAEIVSITSAFSNGASAIADDGSVITFRRSQISAMAAMPDASGYWFSADDGGLFNYGGAPFYGSGTTLPNLDVVVDMATDGSATVQQLAGLPALRTHYEQTHAPRNLRLAIAAGNR